MEKIRTGDLSATWVPESGEVVVQIQGIEKGPFRSSSYPLNTPRHPKEHAIYRAIRTKATQAKRWMDAGNTYHPLVLYLGACDGISQLGAHSNVNSVSLRQAVFSALNDPAQIHPIDMYNSAGSWPGGSLRVKGASLISAVVVTLIVDTWDWPGHARKIPRQYVFQNACAAVQLSEIQANALSALHCANVEYGFPDWNPLSEPEDPLERSKRRYGSVVYGELENGSFYVEIPAVVLARILAGVTSATDAWNEYGSSPPRFDDLLRRALESGRDIVGAEYVPMAGKVREENRIRLVFSEPRSLVLRTRKADG